jgi:hypothetical protein
VELMPGTKTERRPAAKKQAATRKRRVAHESDALAWNALATMKAALERFDETNQESQP